MLLSLKSTVNQQILAAIKFGVSHCKSLIFSEFNVFDLNTKLKGR